MDPTTIDELETGHPSAIDLPQRSPRTHRAQLDKILAHGHSPLSHFTIAVHIPHTTFSSLTSQTTRPVSKPKAKVTHNNSQWSTSESMPWYSVHSSTLTRPHGEVIEAVFATQVCSQSCILVENVDKERRNGLSIVLLVVLQPVFVENAWDALAAVQ